MLTYADLEISLRMQNAGRLSRFPGTTIRGLLGYALKQTVCIVRHRDCERCILRTRCAFPTVFEGVPPADREFMRKYPFVPQPFVLRADLQGSNRFAAGDALDFGIRLFGEAATAFPYVIYAFARAGESGFGTDRVPFKVERVTDGDSLIHAGADPSSIKPPKLQQVEFKSDAVGSGGAMRLEFRTPLRMRTDGRFNARPSIAEITRAAIRRVRILHNFYGDGELDICPEELLAATEHVETKRVEWLNFSVQRHSRRQGGAMTLDGVIGCIEAINVAPSLLAFLKNAAAVHVGKATSFGFGRFEVEAVA